jgi:hypothetical protein
VRLPTTIRSRECLHSPTGFNLSTDSPPRRAPSARP